MALSRFVLTSRVTVAAGTATGTSTGGATTAGSAWAELWGVTFERGQVIVAHSSAGSAPPQLLYQAIGAVNLRVYVQGTDDTPHFNGVSN
jgi:hypothetical protein